MSKKLLKFQLLERTESGEVLHEPFPVDPIPVNTLNDLLKEHDLSCVKDEELRKKLEKQVVSISFKDEFKENDPKFVNFYRFVSEVMLKEDAPFWNNWGCVLTLLDAVENPLERWTMKEIRPLAINFGDLDYSDSCEFTIEFTFVYNEVVYELLKIASTT
jgi:hypothetical protein